MLQSMGSRSVGRDLAGEQEQHAEKSVFTVTCAILATDKVENVSFSGSILFTFTGHVPHCLFLVIFRGSFEYLDC